VQDIPFRHLLRAPVSAGHIATEARDSLVPERLEVVNQLVLGELDPLGDKDQGAAHEVLEAEISGSSN
jgi:hypothetical protein